MQAQENDTALGMLKSVLDELDSIEDSKQRMESAIRGVFAGNIFDMGASASAALFVEGAAPGATTFGAHRYYHSHSSLCEVCDMFDVIFEPARL